MKRAIENIKFKAPAKKNIAVSILLALTLVLTMLNGCGSQSQKSQDSAATTAAVNESVQASSGQEDKDTDSTDIAASAGEANSEVSEKESRIPIGTESSLEVIDHDLATGQESTTIFDYVELDPIYFEADVLGEEEETQKGGLFHGSLLETMAFPDMSCMKNTIFGADDRQFLNYTKRTTYPYCAMVSIEVKYPNGEWYNGSGFLTGPNTVATCAHMLYKEECGGAAELVDVYAGRDGSSTPYGVVKGKKYSYPANFAKYSKYGYTNDAMTYDYGVIQLESNLGTKVGWLALTPNKVPKKVNITGFYNFRENTVSGEIEDYNSDLLFYTIDTLPGSSGSPVYDAGNNVYGINIAQNDYSNKAVRITSTSYSFLTQYDQEREPVRKEETPKKEDTQKKEETQKDDDTPEKDKKKGMLFPDSDVRYLTNSEINALSAGDLRFAINEIYARHGYIFTKKLYKDYFSQFSWYTPTYKKSSRVEKKFNTYEKKNVKKLAARSEYLENAQDTEGMIFPDSNSRYLTTAEIKALSATDLRYAINEIYARRGYKFTKSPYKEYFARYSWYKPIYTSTDDVEKLFNKYEAMNIENLAK